jgi:hypothetical protein
VRSSTISSDHLLLDFACFVEVDEAMSNGRLFDEIPQCPATPDLGEIFGALAQNTCRQQVLDLRRSNPLMEAL